MTASAMCPKLSKPAGAVRATVARWGPLTRDALAAEFILVRGYSPEVFDTAVSELRAAGELRDTEVSEALEATR